jgi:drug/metabolite transporter (DMT)-like permease
MPARAFAILTVVTSAAFTLSLRGVVGFWPIGLAGTFSRIVTLVLLGTWILSRGDGWRRLRPGRMLSRLLLMSAISIAINLLWFGSLQFTTATNVAMLMCLDLVFVVLIGALLGLERIGMRELALLPPMLAGMALLVGAAEGNWGGHLLGDLMAVGAAFLYAINAFVIRRILPQMDEEAVSLYNHGLSTFGFVGLALCSGDFQAAQPALTNAVAWAWIAAVGIVAAVSLPLYYAALCRMEVWRLRAWMLASPVLVAAVEWLLGVRLGASQWLGAAIVLGGLALLIHLELRARAAQPATAAASGPAKTACVASAVNCARGHEASVNDPLPIATQVGEP